MMACNCKHSKTEGTEGLSTLSAFRELFIKRMTVDSETQDARRREFNQAIFSYSDDGRTTFQCFCETDMDMVLRCFDDAVKDWRRTFCDVENCKRR